MEIYRRVHEYKVRAGRSGTSCHLRGGRKTVYRSQKTESFLFARGSTIAGWRGSANRTEKNPTLSVFRFGELHSMLSEIIPVRSL